MQLAGFASRPIFDLIVSTDKGGSWYVQPRSEAGERWISQTLRYDGARTFTGKVPLRSEDVSRLIDMASMDGLRVYERPTN